jgi:hypothetical protein
MRAADGRSPKADPQTQRTNGARRLQFTSSPPRFSLPIHVPGSIDHVRRLVVARRWTFEKGHFFDCESALSAAGRVLGSNSRTPDDTRKVTDVLVEVDLQLSRFRVSSP